MGFEYYAKELTEINYRSHDDYLWKADYSSIFLDNFSNLRLVRKDIYPYISEQNKGNEDCMYLLEKIP